MTMFRRDYYIGHPVDDSNMFEKKMNDILARDDPDMLHHYVKVFSDNYHYPALLDMCFDRGATKCARRIIQGYLPHGYPNLGFDHREPRPDVPVLYNVINMMCEPNVFHNLLYDCNGKTQVNKPYFDLLPIHWLLDLLLELPPFSYWFPGQSLSTVIDSLFLPEMIPKLECARMLVQHTDYLNQIALGYIHNGEIIPLAALLLVAPFTWGDFVTLKSYTTISSKANHDNSATPETYSVAAALLYIFQMDGDKLTSKFNDLQKGIDGGGCRSIVNMFIQKASNINFERRLFSKPSNMTDGTKMHLDNCKDFCELYYQLMLHLVNELESIYQFQSGVGLQTFISLVLKLRSNVVGALEHFKCPDVLFLDSLSMRLLQILLNILVDEYLPKWSPGQSLLKLIILIFLQPESRPILNCVREVAKCTYSVNEVAWNLIKQGKIMQLAGLLLVAYQDVMKPFYSGDNIKEATSMENVVSQVFYGVTVVATVDAAGLFEIFGKAGGILTECWLGVDKDFEPTEAIVEIALLMNCCGIQVLSTDVDLTDIYGNSWHRERLKSTFEKFGLEIDSIIEISRKSPFPSVKSVEERCQLEVPSLDSDAIHMMELLGRYLEGT